MNIRQIIILSIVMILILGSVIAIAHLSPKYEWYLFLTATSASLTAAIIYGYVLRPIIEIT